MLIHTNACEVVNSDKPRVSSLICFHFCCSHYLICVRCYQIFARFLSATFCRQTSAVSDTGLLARANQNKGCIIRTSDEYIALAYIPGFSHCPNFLDSDLCSYALAQCTTTKVRLQTNLVSDFDYMLDVNAFM